MKEKNLELSLEETAVEREIYKIIHESGLSYQQMKHVFEAIDIKILNYLLSREISSDKKPLTLTRGKWNSLDLEFTVVK